MPPHPQEVLLKIREIVAEMKRAGVWHAEEPPRDAFAFERAFAGDTMDFTQWIQFVLIPNVEQIAKDKGQFPTRSEVAVQAVREFDGAPFDSDRLLSVLSEFDALFGS